MSLLSKVQIIDDAIDTIKTTLDLPQSTSLQEVVNSVGPIKPTQTKTITPTTQQQVVSPDSGYELSSVTVNAVTSAIDQNITASNIKKDVQILGVNGTYTTNAYKVSSIQEMNAITNMGNGDLCVVYSDGGSSALPSGYTEVEYLQSSGTQYIDTGYKPFQTQAELKFQQPSTQNVHMSMAGAYGASNAQYNIVQYNYIENKFTTTDSSAASFPAIASYDSSIHTVIYNDENNKVKFDGTVKQTVSDLSNQSTYNLWLFCYHGNSDNPVGLFIGKIYYFKLKDKDTGNLVRNMIPAVRNSDSVAGMYDTVNDVFYTNQGTGTFTVGAVVPSGIDYTIYQYSGSTWVDITDEILTNITITPSTSSQTPTVPTGYKGFSNVTVNAVTAAIDNNIVAGNIKNGVTILGVTGTVAPDVDTHAYKVTTVEEMEALTGMEEGDYCIIKGVPTYVIPENATFTRFTGSGDDILNGTYADYLFIFTPNNREAIMSSTDFYISGYQKCPCFVDISKDAGSDSYTLNTTTYQKLIWQFVDVTGGKIIKALDGRYLKKAYINGSTSYKQQSSDTTLNVNEVNTFFTSIVYNINNNLYTIKIDRSSESSASQSHNTFSPYYDAGSHTYKNYLSLESSGGIALYYCRLQTTTVDHLVYQYRNNAWVNVTDDILVPTTNVTPTTSSQTLPIPAGYEGFKTVNVAAIQTETKSVTPSTSSQTITPSSGKFISQVNVSAVDNTIDANIVAGNIKDGVSILGVTGTLEEGVDTHAYKVTTVEEMNAITTMSDGDYCVIKGIPTYVIPEVATFTRFTGSFQDIRNEVYKDYIFVLSNNTYVFSTEDSISSSQLRKIVDNLISANDTVDNIVTANNKNMIFKFVIINSKLYLQDLDGYYLKGGREGTTSTFSVTGRTKSINADGVLYFQSNPSLNVDSNTYSNFNLYNGYNLYPVKCLPSSNGWAISYTTTRYDTASPIKLYACRMQTTTVDHLVYQYRVGTGWVDVTDDILVSTTNVTPSTSAQTITIPAGYRGLKTVNISAVDSSIDANILAENIKDGVTILGVTGTYTGQ